MNTSKFLAEKSKTFRFIYVKHIDFSNAYLKFDQESRSADETQMLFTKIEISEISEFIISFHRSDFLQKMYFTENLSGIHKIVKIQCYSNKFCEITKMQH